MLADLSISEVEESLDLADIVEEINKFDEVRIEMETEKKVETPNKDSLPDL